MTIFRYNGISLPYPETINFVQSAVYDPEGMGVDWYVTQFDIMIQTKINFNYLSDIAPDLVVNGTPVTDNAAQIMALIRSRLLKPRRDLSVTANGVELIPRPQQGTANVAGALQQVTNLGTVDAQNGPKPQSCQIIQLTNRLYLVTYHIIAHYWENNSLNTNGNPMITNSPGNVVLYNRWSEQQDIDHNNFSTRTRIGKFVIRSDNTQGIIADEVRTQMAVVGLPKRFLRQSSKYVVSPDGLSIMYQIVDRQVFKLPPPPAYSAVGTYSESSTPQQGHTRFGNVHLRLEGAPNTDQQELVEAALAVAGQKVRNRGAAVDSQGRLALSQVMNAQVTVGMYDNWVEVDLTVMFNQGTSQRIIGIAGWTWDVIKSTLAAANGTPFLCETPLSDNLDDPPPYDPRGSNVSLLLRAANYYDPSVGAALTPQGQLNVGLPVGLAGKVREV